MGTTEIVLLVLGIIAFVLSFVLPAKREKLDKETLKEAKEEIRKIVDEAVKEANSNIEDNVTEVSDYNVEKAERAMERLCNEKIMAINEYSDTVMEDIHKNHTEVLFLYDMLNDKHENIKNTAVEVDMAVKAANKEVSELKETINAVPEPKVIEAVKETVNEASKDGIKFERLDASPNPESQENAAGTNAMAPDVEISFANLGMENSNEEILRLHKEGKSNVAIAKELGLGVGEVKLVIDLFEGM